MVYVKWVLGPHNELNPLQWSLGVGGPYLDVDGRIILFERLYYEKCFDLTGQLFLWLYFGTYTLAKTSILCYKKWHGILF